MLGELSAKKRREGSAKQVTIPAGAGGSIDEASGVVDPVDLSGTVLGLSLRTFQRWQRG